MTKNINMTQKNLCINHQNKSYILANNNINQNLIIIDVLKEKKILISHK